MRNLLVVKGAASRSVCGCLAILLAAASLAAGGRKEFSFNKVALKLLNETNLLDDQLDKRGLRYRDAELESYLHELADRLLVDQGVLEHVDWKFRVLRDPLPNAFALPNGSVYLNSGLLALLDNEDQLASVIAHEVTHVTNRHSYLAHKSYRKKMVAIHIFSAVGAYAPTNAAWGVTLNVISGIVPSILAATIYGYSRELEREADVVAVRKLTDAGYDAGEMVNVFKTLQKAYEPGDASVFYTSHPKLAERISYVSAMAPATAQGSATSAERYWLRIQEVSRESVMLSIAAGRHRTAVVYAQRLVRFDPKLSDNLFVLGEAFRSLGPRRLKFTRAETKWRKLTGEEIENRLKATEEGRRAHEENLQKAEDLYGEALQLDPSNSKIHRGWGLLCAEAGRFPEAIEHYRSYLDLAPNAPDRDLIQRRIQRLEGNPGSR